MNLARRILIMVICLPVLTALISGCKGTNTKAEDSQIGNDGSTTGGSNRKMEKTEMTEEEKALLMDVFDDKRRIEEGDLLTYQAEALSQLRAGEEYLARKYADHVFQLESLDPANKFRPWAELYFTGDDSPLCVVKITPSGENSEYICEDNFYGFLLEEMYDSRVGKILEEAGYTAKVYTRFRSTVGSELPSKATVEELLSYNPRLSRDTDIFVTEDGTKEAMLSSIKEVIRNAGLYGSYWLFFVDSLEDDIQTLEDNKKQWQSLTFSCFDID